MVGWFLLLICNETQVYVMFSNNSLQYKQKLVSPYTRAYANFVVAVALGPPRFYICQTLLFQTSNLVIFWLQRLIMLYENIFLYLVHTAGHNLESGQTKFPLGVGDKNLFLQTTFRNGLNIMNINVLSVKFEIKA